MLQSQRAKTNGANLQPEQRTGPGSVTECMQAGGWRWVQWLDPSSVAVGPQTGSSRSFQSNVFNTDLATCLVTFNLQS